MTEVIGRTPCIGVRDSGPGIPADRLADVFERMVRLETSRSRETGGGSLGMTIARFLARRNGGTITLTNLPERGLKATVRPIIFLRPAFQSLQDSLANS